MFTSDTKLENQKALYIARNDLFAAIFCMAFGAIYETFSHDVYSYFMLYAFSVPLLGGTLPWLLMGLSGRKRRENTAACQIWHAGLAAITVGCIFQGMLEIYGTTNKLTNVYWTVGGLLLVFPLLLWIGGRIAEIWMRIEKEN